MIFDENELLGGEKLRKLQLERLQKTVKNVYENVAFYKNAFDKKGVKPSDIKSLDDLSKLPFTTKQDLRDNYPYGMFTVPMEKIVRIHASSGTTGKPTVCGYTQNDIKTWSILMARVFAAAGVTKNDIVQNAYGYGLFTGGLGAHYGAEELGAAVVPISGGNTKKQIQLLGDFGSTCLTCTPSFALYLYDAGKELGIDFSKLPLKVAILGAEPWSEGMRKEIEEKLSIDAINLYGLSEIIGPGVSFECIEEKSGMHINEDHFIAEIIDPETGEQLPYGSRGELVITTITKEAFPLIRYRTKDITVLSEPAKCSCGRSFVKMERVTGRSDDMLIIRGVNVFPSQVEDVITKFSSLSGHYQLVIKREGRLDTLTIEVEATDEFARSVGSVVMSDGTEALAVTHEKVEALKHNLKKDIKDLIGITTEVKLFMPKTLPRFEGKAKRVIDKRVI